MTTYTTAYNTPGKKKKKEKAKLLTFCARGNSSSYQVQEKSLIIKWYL